MKPSHLLLGSLAFLVGCNACSQKKPEPAANPEAPPPTAVSNDVIPSKETVTTVFFTTKGQTRFWMETSNGTPTTPPEASYWTGEGVTIPENDGWRTYLADGTHFATAAAPAAGLTSVVEVLKKETEPPAGYAWEDETGSNGLVKVFINPAMGKRQRIGAFPEPPSEPVWMEATRPAVRGTEAPMLSKAAGFQTREDGKAFKNEPPVGSTPIAQAAASAEDLAAWTADLTALRGTAVTVDLSQSIDLNGDGAAEGFLCVTGGRGNPCLIADKVGEQVRYYTTTLQWAPGNPELPQFFSTDKGTYISHSPEGAVNNRGGGVIRLVRFDGSGYATESIQ